MLWAVTGYLPWQDMEHGVEKNLAVVVMDAAEELDASQDGTNAGHAGANCSPWGSHKQTFLALAAARPAGHSHPKEVRSRVVENQKASARGRQKVEHRGDMAD